MSDQQRQASYFQGFDGLRLCAALAVIFSHSYLIATGTEEGEPFVRLLGPKNILGLYGVFAFFIISGFLLAKSLASHPSAIRYTLNRIFRIGPAFLLCVLVTALLIGPLFTSLGVGEYFSNAAVFEYVTQSVDTFGDMPLPGLFSYQGLNGMGAVVNGSLWSLKYEALSYVLLLVLWIALRSSRLVAAVIVTLGAAMYLSPAAANLLPGVAYTLPFFAGGVLMHILQARFGTHWPIAVASALGLVASSLWGYQQIAFALFGAYLVVFLGERRSVLTGLTNRLGDCSYGLYLFGWPAEQMVRQMTGTHSPLVLFSLAAPLAFVLAFGSCHLVEQPAMRLRKPARALAQRAVESIHRNSRTAAIWGAKIAFGIGAVIILTSRVQWWYLVQSMGLIAFGCLIGSGVAAGSLALHRYARRGLFKLPT